MMLGRYLISPVLPAVRQSVSPPATYATVRQLFRACPAAGQRTFRNISTAMATPTSFSAVPPSNTSNTSSKVFTNYALYKGRAALSVVLVPPTFAERATGGGRVLQREGVMLLEFANVNPGQAGASMQPGNSNRTYNWANKILFSLDVNELGTLLVGEGMGGNGLVFYHDPAKLGRTGEPIKKLGLRQMPDGNIMFNLTAGPDNVSVAVTKNEFEVIKNIASFAIPRLLGFDEVLAR